MRAPGDIYLLCSDGLWSALPEHRLLDLPAAGELESALNALSEEAEKCSYPHSDNISLVGLRWLSPTDADAQTANTPSRVRQHSETAAVEEKDPLQQAIDEINRAILTYASEMKK